MRPGLGYSLSRAERIKTKAGRGAKYLGTSEGLYVSTDNELRPDGRVPTQEVLKLRAATRGLRLHLDVLPIDYDFSESGDRILASLAFMSSRHRYDCAESMLGAGFGGAVVGALARSLFYDGLRWLWIEADSSRRNCLTEALTNERHRLCELIDDTQTTCPILPRWLMPLGDVPALLGRALGQQVSSRVPEDDQLVEEFLASTSKQVYGTKLNSVGALLDASAVRGAALVLAHAGHGNYLGLQSTLTEDGVPGHDLRHDHEALFMHVAAFGVAATLIGAAEAIPQLWPSDVPRVPFIEEAVRLTGEVSAAATAIHRLVSKRAPSARTKWQSRPLDTYVPHPKSSVAVEGLLPDVNSVATVSAAAEDFYDVAKSYVVSPWTHGPPLLHSVLSYAGGHSNLEAVMATYTAPGSAIISAFAARMLLEEAARLHWRYSATEAEFEGRATQFFDEYRYRRRKTGNLLVGDGIPRHVVTSFLGLPSNVRVPDGAEHIAANRTPIPSLGWMLRQMGEGFPEPGWLEVAYSLLSQLTHNTPLGTLHTLRFARGTCHGNELSVEMLALALDVACIGSAKLIGWSTVILAGGNERARQYRARLEQQARVVHDAARLVHGLD